MVEFNDIANDSSFKVTTCHKNVRGDYTIVFEDRNKHHITFANVAPVHVPNTILSQEQQQSGSQQQQQHLHFDDIIRDNNYRVIDSHYNVRGDVTFVFEHTSGAKKTFANVNPSNVPSDFLPTTFSSTGTGYRAHHTLQDVLNNMDKYELLDKHNNVRGDLTLVFQEKDTGAKFTLANVNQDHLPSNFYKY
jgi:hypothetical protein